ncbi:signal peptidase II [Candidatus Puniceispirillum sp.]|jgi:signal peptidase II|uniref:signal peptidase II n=1 Tax=Candidatus Puniceispirillum sp. TaxID=2026719 RepID=UPI001ECB1CC3|nr:signal peptidase II [Candidatus Puniceispirillum sp.]MBT6566823.1 signal peptidase II [Candidatus Puniceispirillum sp.]
MLSQLHARLATRPTMLILAIALVIIGADQLSKQYMLDWIFFPPVRIAILPFLNMVPVWNSGMSFGLLADGGMIVRFGLAGLAVAVAGWFLWSASSLTPIQRVAGGAIAGGAIGNAIDRLRFGQVVDFIDLHVAGWHWPAFNVADVTISIGAFLWIVSLFYEQENKKT